MAILEALFPMRKSAGSFTFKRRKADGRIIVTQKIDYFHNHRTTLSMKNKLTMINARAMYRYLKPQMRENVEADGSNRNPYLTYLHLNKPITRCWLPQEESRQGNAILEPHYISNGTLIPVLCQLDDEDRMLTDIKLGLTTLEGVTVGEWSRDLLKHNRHYQPNDLLKFVYLRQESSHGSHCDFHRIKDESCVVMLEESDERLLSAVVDTTLWGVLDGCLAMRQPLSYAAATVVHLHPEEFPLYHDRWTVFNALRQHLAAGLPLSTYVKPDTRPLTYKVSRQQLMCVNPLIDEYSSEECFARAASEFGPIRDFM